MDELKLPVDYSDLLVELSEMGAEFVIVGGWAVAIHGHGRATDDLDIFVRPSPENGSRVFQALVRYGAPVNAHGVTAELFSREGYGYRIGRKPMLIELLTGIDGVSFDEASNGAVQVSIGGKQVRVIGRQALLANKRAAGRAKDLADIEALEAGEEEDG